MMLVWPGGEVSTRPGRAAARRALSGSRGRRMKLLRTVVCCALLHTAVASAADESGEFALKGAGFLTCKTYVDERQKRSNIYYMIGGWLEGFVSAHNKYAAETYDVTSFESLELLLLIIDNHCKSSPQDQLYPVINSIIAKLHPDRLKHNSPMVEIAEGERKTALHRETISRIQAELARLGLYHAEVDGRFTDATRSAIIAFQSDIGFEKTGFPDQATLWRLLQK